MANPVRTIQTRLALNDILSGMRATHLWGLMAWHDIRQRYRRSMLGPFWLTISMGVMVAGIGFLYSELFRMRVADYVPFLTAGLIIWTLISTIVNDSCVAFIQAEAIIKQVNLPLSVYVYRVVWRNLIIFGHNALIYVLVALAYSVWPGWPGFLAIPALILICINGVWVGVALGLVCARFRDVPQIVSSIMQVAFFLTPILWKPELLGARVWFLQFNPVHYFVELLRAPLLGHVPGLEIWYGALGISLCGWVTTLIMYGHFRRRIAFWV